MDPAAVPTLSAYLGALGMPGLTAYVGLLDMAAFQPGDTVFVSGAAGAVGSVVGQIAKARGAARVIGSAGSAAKVAHLHELGFDAAFNYKDGPVIQQLAAAAPDGISVYFDNVGADHLEAAIEQPATVRAGRAVRGDLRVQRDRAAGRPAQPGHGRRQAADPARLHRLRPRRPPGAPSSPRWGSGSAPARSASTRPLWTAGERAQAFIGMLRGENIGKMVVRI